MTNNPRKRRQTYTVELPIGRWAAFPVHGTRIMPRVPAIYVLFRDGKVVYIGQTINLRQRFTAAYRRRDDLQFAKIKRVASPAILDGIERRLIRRLKPIENHEHTGRHRSHPRRRPSYDESYA